VSLFGETRHSGGLQGREITRLTCFGKGGSWLNGKIEEQRFLRGVVERGGKKYDSIGLMPASTGQGESRVKELFKCRKTFKHRL